MNRTDAPSGAPAAGARIIPRSEHTVSRSRISPNALRVLHRLREGGYQAFLVGGCVRDLLLGLEPKDFDVATNALPEDVKRLFRNCRLIGRRFRLAHVFFGRETIEVATFRAASAPSQGEEPLGDADPEDGEAPELDSPAEVEAAIEAALDEGPDEAAELLDLGPEAETLEDAEDIGGAEIADVAETERLAGGEPGEPVDEHLIETVQLPALEEEQGAAGKTEAARSAGSGASRSEDVPPEQEGTAGEPVRSREQPHSAANGVAHSDAEGDEGTAPSAGARDDRPESDRQAPGRGAFRGRSRRRDRFTEEDEDERLLDPMGRILRDNVYGTIDEDVWRRDFTANALYYNIADFSLWDYVGGFEDIAARRLRLIGDPETRYREDPVRMLRAARFEAKLGFTLEEHTAEPIGRLKGLLAHVPPARLFDECLKLFLTGHGARSLEVLRKRGLLEVLLPDTSDYLEAHRGGVVEQLLMSGLRNTDERAQAGKPVTPTYLFALLLYGPIAREIESTPPQYWHELHTILAACDRAVRNAQQHISIPRRFTLGVREMFALQPRLEHPRPGRRVLRTLEHPRFRAAYDMLLLRAEHGLAPKEMAEWWTRIQEVPHDERVRMADSLAAPGHGASSDQRPVGRRGPRRRRRRRSAHHPA